MTGLCVHAPQADHIGNMHLRPIADLATSHGLNAGAQKAFGRMFGLKSIAMSDKCHGAMLTEALVSLVGTTPDTMAADGTLIYVRTQTHNTVFGDDWFQAAKQAAGLDQWTHFAFGMTHCASGLAVLHVLNQLAADRSGTNGPVIILAGEKAFHPVVNKLGTSLLGEIPTAALVSDANGLLELKRSGVKHLTQFYANPDQMAPSDRQEFADRFATGFQDFIATTFTPSSTHFDHVVFFNMNAPLLQKLSAAFGWQDQINIQHITTVGHGYCADIFLNLSDLLNRGQLQPGQRVLALVAGMGVTFAGVEFQINHHNGVNHAS